MHPTFQGPPELPITDSFLQQILHQPITSSQNYSLLRRGPLIETDATHQVSSYMLSTVLCLEKMFVQLSVPAPVSLLRSRRLRRMLQLSKEESEWQEKL